MPGYSANFSINLLAIPCHFPAKGNFEPLEVSATIQGFRVTAKLIKSPDSVSIKSAEKDFHAYFYDTLEIQISDKNEDLSSAPFITGRAMYLLHHFQPIILETINRLIDYFKYTKKHPKLREVTTADLLEQDESLYNPIWKTSDGTPFVVSEGPLSSGIISFGKAYYLTEPVGIEAITVSDQAALQAHFGLARKPANLSLLVLSDAQDAALSNNIRRATLELAIAIETFVKSSFFKQERIAGAAFEYLEDKGRETLKVTELLDTVSNYAFGESFKSKSKKSYQTIDYIFRCRNKVAHRGDAIYRDDQGTWHRPNQNDLNEWWSATLEMFDWLNEKVASMKEPPSNTNSDEH
ncbi:hypothetical protein FA342_01380 [Pseudomonas aeruginosa]|nr:hypothetical protein [Pseudomonas aeruginosa]MCO2263179.1 hypothetical protein [Pseudomonas aeruginosa]MCO2289794.1 hypothetical protein [Pseudomonas aeruginosa]MCO2458774.1 hypothetical protein [Pseudomonas aeruginosa]MCO2490400.1 hypothetical protein [Pseudomonas aeruginosa]